MSLALAISGLTQREDGEKVWTVETVSWWDERELLKDPRFAKLDLGPEKLVYEAILETQEAMRLNAKYKQEFLGAFEGDALASNYQERRKQQVEELENKLNDPRTPFVSLWVFEWDY